MCSGLSNPRLDSPLQCSESVFLSLWGEGATALYEKRLGGLNVGIRQYPSRSDVNDTFIFPPRSWARNRRRNEKQTASGRGRLL